MVATPKSGKIISLQIFNIPLFAIKGQSRASDTHLEVIGAGGALSFSDKSASTHNFMKIDFLHNHVISDEMPSFVVITGRLIMPLLRYKTGKRVLPTLIGFYFLKPKYMRRTPSVGKHTYRLFLTKGRTPQSPVF